MDGTFLQSRHRAQFRALGAELGVPFVIVDFVASVDTLGARVQESHQAGTDASKAHVGLPKFQQRTAELLSPDEQVMTVTCDTESALEPTEFWRSVVNVSGLTGLEATVVISRQRSGY